MFLIYFLDIWISFKIHPNMFMSWNLFVYSQIPELMNCAEKVTDAMSVCLGDQGKEDLKTFVGVVDAALEFLCYKGGERIASK